MSCQGHSIEARSRYGCFGCEHFEKGSCPIQYWYDAYLTGAECPCKKPKKKEA